MAVVSTITPPYADRRLALVEAAQDVVARGGLRGLTHRAVDAAAGLPEGSCSSYFRTRIALLTALTRNVGHLLAEETLALAERLREGEGLPEEEQLELSRSEVTALFTRLVENPDLVLVQAELALESRRQPSLRKELDPWRAQIRQIVTDMVAGAGRRDPERRAQTLVAAMEGVLLSGLQQPEAERAAYLDQAITMLLAGLY